MTQWGFADELLVMWLEAERKEEERRHGEEERSKDTILGLDVDFVME